MTPVVRSTGSATSTSSWGSFPTPNRSTTSTRRSQSFWRRASVHVRHGTSRHRTGSGMSWQRSGSPSRTPETGSAGDGRSRWDMADRPERDDDRRGGRDRSGTGGKPGKRPAGKPTGRPPGKAGRAGPGIPDGPGGPGGRAGARSGPEQRRPVGPRNAWPERRPPWTDRPGTGRRPFDGPPPESGERSAEQRDARPPSARGGPPRDRGDWRPASPRGGRPPDRGPWRPRPGGPPTDRGSSRPSRPGGPPSDRGQWRES